MDPSLDFSVQCPWIRLGTGRPLTSIFGKLIPPSPIFQRFLEKAFPRMVPVLGQHLHKGAVEALAEEMGEHGRGGTLGPDVAT